MAQMQELQNQMTEKYALETRLRTLSRQIRELEEEIPQRIYEQRAAAVARMEYEGGSFRGFLDKLSGKREQRLEQLQQQERHAAQALESARQTLQRQKAQREAEEAALEPYRNWEQEQAEHLAASPELKREFDRLDALFTAKGILPVLDELWEALQNTLEYARPNVRLEAIPGEMQIRYQSQSEALARQVYAGLIRIAERGQLLEIHPYFMNPVGYVSGVAAQYGQLDRLNGALNGVIDAREQLNCLIQMLEA